MASAAGMATATPPSNIITGKVMNKESRRPIQNLIVELFDHDTWPDPENPNVAGGPAAEQPDPMAALLKGDVSVLYKTADRIGSSATDAAGQFIFEVQNQDFNLPGRNEQKPDLILLVLAPDEPGLDANKRLLFFTKDVRWNAGSREAYLIGLPTLLLQQHQIPFGEEVDSRAPAANRVRQYIDKHQQDMAFNTGVAEFHGLQTKQEITERKTFRKQFLKSVAADLSVSPPGGIVVAEGDNIRDKNLVAIDSGVLKANEVLGAADARGVPVNLYLTPADRTRLQQYFANATGEFVDIPEADIGDILFRKNSSDDPGTLLFHNNPIATYCAANDPDVLCAQAYTGLTTQPAPPPETQPGAPVQPAIGNADIPTYVGRLIQDMQPPDVVLQPGGTQRPADRGQVQRAVNEFAMPAGPAEVPAFYDSDVMQVAFDHVWKQLFDENIPNLAYTANTLGKNRFGVESIVTDALRNGLVSTLGWALGPLEVPAVIARHFDLTVDDYSEMSPTARDELKSLAVKIDGLTSGSIAALRTIQSLTEQGDRLIDAVRQDDYYSLHKTLRELHSRLTGKYEFTVFAADKDYHSVNFGLMTTYREFLTPVTYQPGCLLNTFPLSPREERRYSVKTTRNRKRSTKEAQKNNSTISREQQSTSHVESEIIAKAQTKTTFDTSAEGDYDIYISSGKAKSSFGVEALSESTQNRRDIRDALLKAVQEYRLETSVEVTSDTEFSSEATESGTIVNPNDELAVTYLFYELQKRYRVAEQIYRVLPVVLVAQEMPSPDQITPAWVIEHDWILNRVLLDDSFRPTLSYLANKSVGDDLGIRELRRNLRQQRNLVDTLTIQFSAASVDADNRYKALEAAITNRIDEEHADRNDSIWTNIGDFFSESGHDPQAAKAREMAAKDAHQYALEKAEKAASALREETANLHSLTDKYNKAVQDRLDNETRVERLLTHLVDNITFYTNAVRMMEPPDQRILRLYKVNVPVLELESRTYRVKVAPDADIFSEFRSPGTEKHRAFITGTLKHNADGSFPVKPLVDVADLSTVLGFFGNYMVFPLRQHNALTEFMAAPYIDTAFGAMDPDQLSNISLDQYSKYICCLHDTLSEADFDHLKPQLKAWLEQLLASPLRNGDEIVVPTGSLFIETLVDSNTVMENFKLFHREVDVFKAIEETRKAGLESVRLAARLLNAERGDPEIDKKIVVQGAPIHPSLDIDNP